MASAKMPSKDTLKKFRSKLNTKLKKGLPKKIKSQLKTNKLANRLNEQAQEAVQKAAQATAQMASNLATTFSTEAAKHSLDQVLLNLEHRGLSFKDSQDLAIKVGRKVLERAEAVRLQIAENPLSPAWLREVRLKCVETALNKTVADETLETSPVASASETEATVSKAAQGVAEPQHGARVAKAVRAEAQAEFADMAPLHKAPSKAKRIRKSTGGASARTSK